MSLRSIGPALAALLLLAACDSAPVTDAGVDAGTASCGEPGSATDDAPCACTSDCRAGAICFTEVETGLPGGRCLSACESDADCQGGTYCEHEDGETGLCVVACETNAACRQGICNEGFCEGYCFSDSDCGSGHCDPDRRVCTDGTPAGGLAPYAACAIDDECRSANCGRDQRCFSRCSLAGQDCGDGFVCVQIGFVPDDLGQCMPACEAGNTCADAELECRATGDGRTACFDPPEDAACVGRGLENTDGRPCGCQSDCVPGSLCLSEAATGFAQGWCFRECSVTTGAPCNEPETTCGGSSSFSFCEDRCVSDTDCGAVGRICVGGFCEPFCTTSADCRNGTCNPYGGQCEPTPTEGLAMGAICGRDDECRSGFCGTGGGTVGYCIGLCRASTQSCPDDAVCHTGGDGDDQGVCYPPCVTVDDCGAVSGRVCAPTTPSSAPNHCE